MNYSLDSTRAYDKFIASQGLVGFETRGSGHADVASDPSDNLSARVGWKARLNKAMQTINTNINGEPIANTITREQFADAYRECRQWRHKAGIFAGMHCAATNGRGWWTHETPERAAHAALHDREQVDYLFILGQTPRARLEYLRSHDSEQDEELVTLPEGTGD